MLKSTTNYRKNRFTKKDIFLLSRKYNWNLRLRKQKIRLNTFLKQSNIRRIASLKKLYSFYSISKRFFKLFYSIYNHRRFSRLHKFIFKKSKKRNYNQSFFFDLDRRVCTLLYRCRLFSKIKYLKQFILNKFLFINNLKVSGYSSVLNPLDFVYFNKSFYTKNLLSSFLVDEGFYLDGLYDKYFKKIIFKFIRHLKLKFRVWRSIFLYKLKRRFFFNFSLVSSYFSNNFFVFFSNNFFVFFSHFYFFVSLKLFYFLNYSLNLSLFFYFFNFSKIYFFFVFFCFFLFYILSLFSKITFFYKSIIKL